jgi:6-phosphogluconolactonase (cycloisomerase 2 family)
VLLSAAFWMSCGSSGKTGYIYLVSQSDKTVGAYKINLSSGVLNTENSTLSPTGKLANTGLNPTNMLFNPARTFAYLVEFGSPPAGAPNSNRTGDIQVYSVNSDNSLNSIGALVNSLPCQTYSPVALATDTGGHFLFVANQVFYNVDQGATCTNPAPDGTPAPGTLTVFGIGSDGKLTQQDQVTLPLPAGAPTSSIQTPTGVGVSNKGNFVYVSDTVNSTVAAYSYDTGTGKLSPIPFSTTTIPIPVDSNPSAVYSPPTGNFLYVASSLSNVLDIFEINDDGTLTAAPNSPQSTGVGPIQIFASPDGKYLFTVDNKSSQVSGYKINQVTGSLTVVSPPAISTGTSPVAATIRSDDTTNGSFWIVVSDTGANAVSTIKIDVNTGALSSFPQTISPVAPYGIASR